MSAYCTKCEKNEDYCYCRREQLRNERLKVSNPAQEMRDRIKDLEGALLEAERERDVYRAVLDGAEYRNLDRLAGASLEDARRVGDMARLITLKIKEELEEAKLRLRFAPVMDEGDAILEELAALNIISSGKQALELARELASKATSLVVKRAKNRERLNAEWKKLHPVDRCCMRGRGCPEKGVYGNENIVAGKLYCDDCSIGAR